MLATISATNGRVVSQSGWWITAVAGRPMPLHSASPPGEWDTDPSMTPELNALTLASQSCVSPNPHVWPMRLVRGMPHHCDWTSWKAKSSWSALFPCMQCEYFIDRDNGLAEYRYGLLRTCAQAFVCTGTVASC